MAAYPTSRMLEDSLLAGVLLLACGTTLTALGAHHGLRDFAVVVSVLLMGPLWLMLRIRWVRSPWARLSLASLAWGGLWVAPLLWRRPWRVGDLGLGSRYNWWVTVLPDLLPFFLLPLAALVIAAVIGVLEREAYGARA